MMESEKNLTDTICSRFCKAFLFMEHTGLEPVAF